jgi:dipeptidyl aminopeptidase/acylaminoacyl peptidase
VPTGHLLFVRGGTLFAALFDVDRAELTGPPIAVIENVQTSPESGNANYRVSHDGSLAYVPAPPVQGRKLVWVDRRGNAEPLPIGPRGFGAPSLSPDGRRLAVHIDDGPRRDIWIYDLGADSLIRATFDGASAAPVWTPDGKRLVYSSTKDGRREIYWQPADGTGQPDRLVADDHSVWAGNWSADQRTLTYTRQPPTDHNDIGLLRLGAQPAAGLIVSSTAQEYWPRISPDSKWLAYTAAENYRLASPEVFVIGLSGAGGKRQVSIDGGSRPVWSRDGRELFYLRGSRFMVASVGSLPEAIGKPQPLPISVRAALSRGADYFGPTGYDVSVDGQRLLIVQEAEEESAPRQIRVVLNWFEELKRRVPSR